MEPTVQWNESQSIMDAYLKNGTKRVIPGLWQIREMILIIYIS